MTTLPVRLILLAAVGLALVACDSKAETPAAAPGVTTPAVATGTASPSASPTPSATAGAPSGAATQVIRYLPTKPDAGTAQDGSCFARSAALSWREDTYRCSVGNRILDPCFALADGAVVCGADPTKADASALLLRLSAPLPAQPLNAAQIEAGKVNGWLVKLPDGTVCGFLTGATAGFEGKRINYGCTNGTSILGDLTPGTTWTARFVTGSVGASGFVPKTDEVRAIATVYQ